MSAKSPGIWTDYRHVYIRVRPALNPYRSLRDVIEQAAEMAEYTTLPPDTDMIRIEILPPLMTVRRKKKVRR